MYIFKYQPNKYTGPKVGHSSAYKLMAKCKTAVTPVR